MPTTPDLQKRWTDCQNRISPQENLGIGTADPVNPWIYRISMRWLGGRCKNTSWERRTRSIPTQARPVTE